ncbi:hypothetical protein GCM10027570_14540 [Streptomonospora sediminis]
MQKRAKRRAEPGRRYRQNPEKGLAFGKSGAARVIRAGRVKGSASGLHRTAP